MADKKKEWDLSSLHALEGACEWIRKRSGALMVVAIRAGAAPDDDGAHGCNAAIAFDAVIDVDPALQAQDILARLELEMSELVEKVKQARLAAREKKSRGQGEA